MFYCFSNIKMLRHPSFQAFLAGCLRCLKDLETRMQLGASYHSQLTIRPYICSSQVLAFIHYIYIILFCLWSFYSVDLRPLFLFLFSTYVCSLMSVVFYALLVVSYAWEVEALFDLPI